MITPLDTQLQQIGQVQARLPAVMSVLLGLLAVVVAAVPFAWAIVRHIDTLAHEAAHATLGSSMGDKVGHIKVELNGNGETSWPGHRTRPSRIVSGFAGYLGPSAFGLGAAKLISAGHIIAVLWLALLFVLLVLPVLRGIFSFAAAIGTGIVLFLVARRGSEPAQAAVAYGLAWLLLISGVRTVLEHGGNAIDARNLRELSLLPRGFWAALWLAGTTAALLLGGSLLV